MRIEAYTQVQQLYNANTKTEKAQSKKSQNFSDQLQISSVGKEIQIAKQAMAASSDIREDVAAPLKASVQAGTYQVNNENFASKLFEKYNEMR